jgi:uncharacterized protein (TIGR02246 family)
MPRLTLCLLAVGIVAGCVGGSDTVPDSSSAAEEGPAEAAVDTLYQRLVAAAEAGDADRYAALYDVRGAILVPNLPAATGRAAVRDWARDFFAQWKVEIDTFSMLDRRIGRDMGFARYRAVGRYLPAGGGAATAFDQKYVDVFVKDSAGAWRFAVHMVSTNRKGPTIWE